jgi:hypothetical protein
VVRPWYLQASFALLVGASAFALVVNLRTHRHPTASAVVPRDRVVESHRQLELVFIASSTCHGLRVPGFKTGLDSVRQRLRRQAARDGAEFVSLGVAVDSSVESGERMLVEFGPFDQLVLGGGWSNVGAEHYLWRDIPGHPIVPQVIVLSRQVTILNDSITFGDERVQTRKAGANEVIAWAKAPPPKTAS